MEIGQIINSLLANAKPFNEISTFSNRPGIYALFFIGKSFPLSGYYLGKTEIVYIGKTESSQQSRDANTHFASGRTGSSTIRRTLGAMLREQLSLTPIPRSEDFSSKSDVSKFKFDTESEERLTLWLKQNLGLSFFEFNKRPHEIDALETLLIKSLKPILNIDWKNPANSYAFQIKQLRKATGTLAYSNTKLVSIVTKPINALAPKVFVNSGNVHKYEDIWTQLRPIIIESISKGGSRSISIGDAPFRKVGNRTSYSFNLEFNNYTVENNISGSAVARDLARILLSSSLFKSSVIGKHVKISLDKAFTLQINVQNHI